MDHYIGQLGCGGGPGERILANNRVRLTPSAVHLHAGGRVPLGKPITTPCVMLLNGKLKSRTNSVQRAKEPLHTFESG